MALKNNFKTDIAENIFYNKYAVTQSETWWQKCINIVNDVCGGQNPLMSKEDRDQLAEYIYDFKFLPGGRYIYYAGRGAKFWNNCFLLKGEEDTREEWARLAHSATSCLMVGGGIGVDYSVFRPAGRTLSRTGGVSSGPIPLMKMINEIGRNVMQGGSRRSALYASLNWQHEDINDFLTAKNWSEELRAMKDRDFNSPAPLDMTNISANYDNAFLEALYDTDIDVIESFGADDLDLVDKLPETFMRNVRQALKTGEPGFSFNFFDKENETLRNACTEVSSEDDSDVCNLGSINLGRIGSIREMEDVTELASRFLVCGTIRAELPYQKVYDIRKKNRRLGLGLMGVHEFLLKRKQKYEMTDDLRKYLDVYKWMSEKAANEWCDRFFLSRPAAYRAIAPTGSIGMLASTTTGIESLYAVAYKRRYLTEGTKWKYEYVVDGTAQTMIDEYGINPDDIETSLDLAKDPERRIKFQADVQDYVDMSISSTINLEPWGSKTNNDDTVEPFAKILARYAHRLRGFTCYPDGARGGQPLTAMPYAEAIKHKGVVFTEHDICILTRGGESSCGT